MSNKKHILFLSSWYPSRVNKTLGNYVQQHAEAIAILHDVTVVYAVGEKALSVNYEFEQFTKNNVTTIVIYFKKHSFKVVNGLRKYKSLKHGIKRAKKFDLIHGNVLLPIGIFVYFFSIKLKVPFVFTEHSTGFLTQTKMKLSSVEKLITKCVVKKSKFVLPVSNELKRDMLSLGFNANYEVIGNVIDTKLFYPTKNENEKYTILHISSFSNEQKNINGILNVVKKLSEERSDFLFKIVGDGNILQLKNEISLLNIRENVIQIEGVKPPYEIAKQLQGSNLYISFSNYETFGIVMLESIACGVPVISTKTGILYELNLTDFTTFVDAGDEDGLLNSIRNSIDSQKKLDFNKMYLLIEEEYSAESIANKYTNIYCNVLKEMDS